MGFPRLPSDPHGLPNRTAGLPGDAAPTTAQRGARPIRRLLPALAFALAAALLVASAPVEAAQRKVTLGISMYTGADVSAVTSTFERFTVGETPNVPAPRIWSLWSQWGVPETREFPTAKANAVRDKGATPFIFWEPWTGNRLDSNGQMDCRFARHKDIASGKYDKYIKRFARDAKAYGGTVLLRYTHEINAKYFPWTTNNCGNTVNAFKKGWRRVVGLFRKVGAKNVKFVWTVAKERCPGGCNPWADHYPGDRYVQYVGFSAFNWGQQKDVWQPMLKSVSGAMKTMREFTRKPVIIAELATAPCCGPDDDMSKPNWIREGYPAVYRRWPQIKAIIWLNVDLRAIRHPDWSLDRPNPATRQAYAEIASQTRFKGRIR